MADMRKYYVNFGCETDAEPSQGWYVAYDNKDRSDTVIRGPFWDEDAADDFMEDFDE